MKITLSSLEDGVFCKKFSNSFGITFLDFLKILSHSNIVKENSYALGAIVIFKSWQTQKEIGEIVGFSQGVISRISNANYSYSSKLSYSNVIKVINSDTDLKKLPFKINISKSDYEEIQKKINPVISEINEEIKKRESLNNFLAFYAVEKQSYIGISYRDENRGGGAFYDHFTFQNITRYKTAILLGTTTNIGDFKSYLKISPELSLKYGIPQQDDLSGKKLPPSIDVKNVDVANNVGLIVIPGNAPDTATKRPNAYRNRRTNERELIRKAYYRGQPILAICGGVWTLCKILNKETSRSKDNNWKGEEKTAAKEVIDHSYRAGMPRVSSNRITHNKPIHNAYIPLGTKLLGLTENSSSLTIPVNSLHQLAVDPQKMPSIFNVCATAKRDDDLAPFKNKENGTKIEPEENTVEAIELKNNGVIVGIQWHPEAYNKNDDENFCPDEHRNIIKNMTKAGKAYLYKRKMLDELGSVLKKIGFFGQSDNKTKNVEPSKIQQFYLGNN